MCAHEWEEIPAPRIFWYVRFKVQNDQGDDSEVACCARPNFVLDWRPRAVPPTEAAARESSTSAGEGLGSLEA